MMKFLCLGYFDPSRMAASSAGDVERAMRQCQPHLEELYGSGRVILDAGLHEDCRVLRRSGGEVVTCHEPYLPGMARIGSAFLIEAADFDEAVSLAKLHPTTRIDAAEAWGWGLEIRPLHYFELDA